MNHQSSRHHHDERSWSVVLFRFTESTGWEKEVGGDKDGITTMVSPRKDRYELLANQFIKNLVVVSHHRALTVTLPPGDDICSLK